MGVGVDQSGQADFASKVDDLGAALGLRHGVAELIDPFAGDAQRDILAGGVALAVVKGTAAQVGDPGGRGLRLGLGESGGGGEGKKEEDETESHGVLRYGRTTMTIPARTGDVELCNHRREHREKQTELIPSVAPR